MTVRPGLLLSAATLLVALGVVFGVLLVVRHDKPTRPFVLDKAQAAQAAENLAIGQRALQAARAQLRAALVKTISDELGGPAGRRELQGLR